MICPCGSGLAFNQCCEPLIKGILDATTPEQLMRSRYAAYATKNANYIYTTYAKITQLAISEQEISEWADETTWLSLQILNHHYSESYGTVEFIASYQFALQKQELHEKSRFIKEQGQWRYLDGNILS
jgi:SEC-C motif domain protein